MVGVEGVKYEFPFSPAKKTVSIISSHLIPFSYAFFKRLRALIFHHFCTPDPGEEKKVIDPYSFFPAFSGLLRTASIYGLEAKITSGFGSRFIQSRPGRSFYE